MWSKRNRPKEPPIENRVPSKMAAEHDQIKVEVIKSRNILHKAIKKLGKQLDLAQPKSDK